MRARKTERAYGLIGGGSPILRITRAQAGALERALEGQGPFKIRVGMRYWPPYIEEAVSGLREEGVRRALALSLYPHYSAATTGPSVRAFERAANEAGLEHAAVAEWYGHPKYIEALTDVIRKGLDSFGAAGGGDIHLLFSAHSIPERLVRKGADPYVGHIEATIKAVTGRLGPVPWHLSYQSKSGPVRWLGPSTDAKLRELAAGGVKRVLAVPISFVSDHIETLYEIDILYKGVARGLGMQLNRSESLNTHPVFIDALKELVLEKTGSLGWLG